ncbi:uncharacterized protein PgNI_08917 [Pyricularia grisea]|uniref:Transmembrane protein n=1 Tax=Pyricularia grisea TaxID=148305 RepID=A0A6P8AVH8_PYRGI|nr:uncharacterized protein PgNI_08917 [Pyricularia grisea]TLD06231.1 hypothetical protein PgNI_08917 [Pyricularia grisea]
MLAKRGYETSILALATVVGATPLLSTADSKHQHCLFASGESGRLGLRSWSADLESAPMNSQTRDEGPLWRIWARLLDTLRVPKGSLDDIQGRQETCDLCERDYINPQIVKWEIPSTASVFDVFCADSRKCSLPRDLVSTVFVTTTLTTTSTFTSFSATVISTVTQTLTFVDVIQPTAAIPPPLKIRRSNAQQSGGAKATTAFLATKTLPRRQQDSSAGEPLLESTTTVTATSTSTTTVTVQGGTRTRFHTVFETTRIAAGISSTFSAGLPGVSSTVARPTNTDRSDAGPGETTLSSVPSSTLTPTGGLSPSTVITVTITTGPVITTIINPIKTLTQTTFPSSAPPTRPVGQAQSSLRADQISGIVLGIILFIILLIILSLLFLRRAQNRRSIEASQRQQLSPECGLVPFNSPATSHSTPGSAGQVRIVIRPAPPSSISARGDSWPLPPGHEGQPTLFLDNNGSTPVRMTPTRWSITSDFGDMPGSGGMVQNSGPLASQRNSGVPSSGVMGNMSPGPSVRDRTEGYYFTPAGGGDSEDTGEAERSSPARNESQPNTSGPESVGGPSRGSSTFRTRLAPPPYQFGPPDWGGVGYGRAF